jgi:hypothetical protein
MSGCPSQLQAPPASSPTRPAQSSDLVVEFPSGSVTTAGFGVLHDRDVIRILDLEFVAKDDSGVVRPVDLPDVVSAATGDFSPFLGSSSGLLDAEDVRLVGGLIEPGSLAGVLVYESVWAASMAAGLRRRRRRHPHRPSRPGPQRRHQPGTPRR